MTARVGAPKHAKVADRQANWHSEAPGSFVLDGRHVSTDRPRGRTVDGSEIELDQYKHFSDDDLLSELVLERMLAGVATGRHAVNEPVGVAVVGEPPVQGRYPGRPRRVDEPRPVRTRARGVDARGVHFVEACCVVALAICTDGTKVPGGLWLGDTENKTVVTNLLADLVEPPRV